MRTYLIEFYTDRNYPGTIIPVADHYRLAFAPDADGLDAALDTVGCRIIDNMADEGDTVEQWYIACRGGLLAQAFELGEGR